MGEREIRQEREREREREKVRERERERERVVNKNFTFSQYVLLFKNVICLTRI